MPRDIHAPGNPDFGRYFLAGRNSINYKCKNATDSADFSNSETSPIDSRDSLKLKIRLLFDFKTYRHIMTEYFLTQGGTINYAYERFGNFKSVDGILLPHNYVIECVQMGNMQIISWTVEVKQIIHNTPIDPQNFHAQ